MHPGNDINSASKSIVDVCNQLSALSSQVGKISEELTSTKEELRKIKNAVSKIPTKAGDPSGAVMVAMIFLALLLALTSNPLKSSHVTHLVTRMPGTSDEAKAVKKLTADYLLPYLAPNLISYESYYFFSVSKLKLGDEEIPLALGIYGNIFDFKTPNEIKEKWNKLTN